MSETFQQRTRLPQFILIVAGVLAACQCIVFALGVHSAREGRIDLRAFYAAGAILRSGHGEDLYSYSLQQQVQNAIVSQRGEALPFLYPAFAALPFVPLSLLPYASAWLVWLAINLGLVTVSAWLLAKQLRTSALSPAVLLLLYASIFGVSVALIQGQISSALLLVFLSAWILEQRQQEMPAGVVLALALMKFQIALPVALLLLIGRKGRMVTGFAMGAVALALLSFLLIGSKGGALYLHSMTTMTAQTAVNAAGAKTHYGMYPTDMPNLHGLLFALSHGTRWGLLATLLLSCAVLVWAARSGGSLLVALPAAMLVSYHMQPHDLTLLLLPLSVLAARWNEGRLDRTTQRALAASLCLLVLPVAGVLMVKSMSCLASLAVCGVLFSAARGEAA